MRLNTKRVIESTEGFTIMELLIATLVFGTALLVVSTAILQFSRVYYKGLTESTVQDVTRTAVDLIAQEIQFSGGNIVYGQSNNGSNMLCIGNQRYSYLTGYEVSDNPSANQTYHALVVDDYASGCTSGTQAQNLRTIPAVSGRELLGTNMRLANLQVQSIGNNTYKVNIRVAYGDDDLLINPNATNSDTPPTACQNFSAGTQFCAVSDITTTVVKRVQ